MMERRTILRLWERAQAGSVLATVTDVEGSSYRRPGAHLFVTAGGERAGSISGGCLEGEVVRKAAWLTAQGAALQRYSTFYDDASEIPYGLGCGGRVEVLLERADTPEAAAMRAALQAALDGEARRTATVLPGTAGAFARVVWDERGTVLFASEGLSAERCGALLQADGAVRGPARACVAEVAIEGGAQRVFFEAIEAQPRFHVFGAADDAVPVVKFASLMGWNVTVADGRAHLATAARFPEAKQVVVLDGGALATMQFSPADAVVLMTHSYEQDRALLRALLPEPLTYLGLLGARSRTRDLLDDVSADLGCTAEACLARVHAPVGLDLGGDGPEAVALAIVAEVHAHLNGKGGGKRTLRADELMQIPAIEHRACPR